MLEPLGISPDDESVYRTVLRHPRGSAPELVRRSRRATGQVRSALVRLEELGLVTRLAGRPTRWVATRPDAAVDVLVAQRQRELALVQEAARDLVHEVPDERGWAPEEHVEVVIGREAVANRFLQLEQRAASELLVLDRPPYAQDTTEPNVGEFDLLARGVSCRGIYAPEALQLPGRLRELRAAISAGEQARVHAGIPMKLAVADRKAAMLPLTFDQTADSALVVSASTLLDALVALFEMLWAVAVPVPGEAGAADEGGRTVDTELLLLLAAGAKDQAIARQLGVSVRTVGRRTADLLAFLEARTRFQGGLQAARLGLIE